jgi:hypothetical protein
MATMPSEDRDELVRLTSAGNSVLAHIWQNALQEEGICCRVLGDYLDAGIGDIPGFSAEVWVKPGDLARAELILREHQDQSEEAAEQEENPDTVSSAVGAQSRARPTLEGNASPADATT